MAKKSRSTRKPPRRRRPRPRSKVTGARAYYNVLIELRDQISADQVQNPPPIDGRDAANYIQTLEQMAQDIKTKYL